MATRLFGTRTPAPRHIFCRSFALRPRFISAEPVSSEESDSRIYSILVSLPDGKEFASPQTLESWYHSILSDGKKSGFDKDPRIISTNPPMIPGFSARLTRDELKALEKKDEFQGAFPKRRYVLHTTCSPDLPRLHQKGTNHGRGMINAVLGMGMIGDEGMSPPPTEWEGQRESDVALVDEDDYLD